MWYGVPVVGVPAIGDQPDNADRMEGLGSGIALPPLSDVQEDQLYDAVMEVVSKPSYREKAGLLSARLRSHKRSGLQRAGGAFLSE